ALLSKKANKPVKLLNNRQEEMEAARPMVPMKIWSRIGMSRDGRLLAKESKIFADNGAYSSHGPAVMIAAAIRFDSVYRQQNIKTGATLVYTNNTPTGAYRGYGANQAAFALESHLDIMARELDIDPLDLRLRNATQTGDVSVHGWKIMSSGLTECLKRVATASKWSKQRPKRKKAHGLGLACSTHICGFRSPTPLKGSTAKVQIDEDGRIQVITGEGDIGQGAATVFTQIVAEELSVSPAKIEVSSLDTEKTPLSLGAYASRVTVIGGNAVLNAARDAKGKIFKMAAFILGEEPTEFYLKKEKVWSKTSPGKSITLKDVATEADRKGTPIIGEGAHEYEGDLLDKKTLFGNLSSNYSFSAHIAEVEVDPETGVVQVIRQFCAHDIGRAINPMACEGQIEGGVAQGMGCALSEALIRHQGKILNSGFTDYKIPKAADMPQIKAFLVESNDPIGPYGAKGMGEEVAVPVAPAICNAIFDAIGVRVKELPIKPEKILRELRRMQG
ncbi:MAG: molybdopterin-dependent oxidoreductase, partial [Deltaproteobacteria bacterium]|nr:molybdopterin-dependent oxidoreductase [Deltaproteobacteria bacterium]